MIKRNNKGFTLLELIISIFILTTVIFVGYRVINKSTIDIKNQGNINKGQLTVNDMNEYLTKDLEKASNVVLESKYINQQQNIITNKNLDDAFKIYSGDKTFDYKYKIFSKEGNEESISATYQVNITKKDENNYKYTIVRTDEINKVSITFINDEIIDIATLDKKIPFEISLSSPYKVSLGYNGKDNKFVRHEFTVDYRLQILPPTIDEILPPPGGSNNNMKFNTIGFWTADSTKKTQDNLYTWVSNRYTYSEDAYADQENGRNDNFNIEGYVKYNNNNTFTGSYIGYNEIKSDTEWQGQVKDISIGSKKIIDIYIYVSKDTTLKDFKIESDEANITIDKKTLKSSDGIDLETGWHSCAIELNKDSLLNFKFTGKLSIDKSKVSSGYAYVVYEKDNYLPPVTNPPAIEPPANKPPENTSNLRGDIVFDFNTRFHNNFNANKTFIGYKSNIEGASTEPKEDQNPANDTESMEMSIFQRYCGDNPVIRVTQICDNELALYKQDFKNIIGITCSVSGNIKINNFILKFETNGGNKEYPIDIELNESKSAYTFNFSDYLDYNEIKTVRLCCKFNFDNMKNDGDKAQVKIDFIYNK